MKCKHCGKEIVGRNPQTQFCSAKCFYVFHHPPIIINCKFCGKPFTKGHGKQKFCSDRCRDNLYEQKRRRNPELKTCPVCGKEFLHKGYWAQCCSHKCRAVQREQEAQAKPEPPKARKLDDWIREAAECNLDYGTYRAMIERGKTFDELKAQAPTHVGVHAHDYKFL